VSVGGSTLLERGVELLRSGGCDRVVVVLGAVVVPVEGAAVVVAPDWDTGMAASLRTGLAGLPGDACVVALVDQPLVGAAAVRRLVDLAGTVDPVLLDRSVWAEIAALTGDAGARTWLRAHPAQVLEVPCDDTGSADDVDTPEDLERVRALLG
jgi:CTP:molybdopterin cytidylyltransferase MocA